MRWEVVVEIVVAVLSERAAPWYYITQLSPRHHDLLIVKAVLQPHFCQGTI
jgi:hypothetical protein